MSLVVVISKVNLSGFSMKYLHSPSFAFSSFTELCAALTQNSYELCNVLCLFLWFTWQVEFIHNSACCWGSGAPLRFLRSSGSSG